jgi:23S rRNA (guanosine2251-2'-O)-methyltransferase
VSLYFRADLNSLQWHIRIRGCFEGKVKSKSDFAERLLSIIRGNMSQRRERQRDHSGRGVRDRSARDGRGGHSSQREKQPTIPEAELVMGLNCIRELLRHSPSRIKELLYAPFREVSPRGGAVVGRREGLIKEAQRLKVAVRECDRLRLDQIVNSDSHQGVVARVRVREYMDFNELVDRARESESFKIVAIDGVLDPQNVGAILRAAECFGVDAVLWSRNRVAPLGAVVSKVSVGASELLSLCPVANLHRAIETLKGVGVWSIGALVSENAERLSNFESPNKWLLVMGSEGDGIQPLIEKSLDFKLYIEMFGSISSLNVSQATSVFLHRLVCDSGVR